MHPARTQRHVQFSSPKAAAHESKYPNIVELAVSFDGLDVTLGRRIINFHKSRHIQPHHGRTIYEATANLLPLVLFRFGNGSRLHRTVRWKVLLMRDEACGQRGEAAGVGAQDLTVLVR